MKTAKNTGPKSLPKVLVSILVACVIIYLVCVYAGITGKIEQLQKIHTFTSYQMPDLFGWALTGAVVGVVILITVILITEYYNTLKRLGLYLGINIILIFALPLHSQIQMYGFGYTMMLYIVLFMLVGIIILLYTIIDYCKTLKKNKS